MIHKVISSHVVLVLAMAILPWQIEFCSAQEAAAVKDKPAQKAPLWIHGTLTFDGKPTKAELWLSREKGIWAKRHGGRQVQFADAKRKVKYVYSGRTLEKLPLGADSIDNMLPVNSLSEGEGTIGSWMLGNEKVISHDRRLVTEDGQPCLEFDVKFYRYNAVLRVHPEHRTPTDLIFHTRSGVAHWRFTSAEKGPTDIFAMGIDKATPLKDRMWEKRVGEFMAKIDRSRESIGAFKLVTVKKDSREYYVVQRLGRRWRVDRYYDTIEVSPVFWRQWFEDRVAIMRHHPLYICDGKMVMENRQSRSKEAPEWQPSKGVAPGDLMQCDPASLLRYADATRLWMQLNPQVSPQRGMGFEVVFQPPERPECVLVKQYAELASVNPLIGCGWYYLDPIKGYAVVSKVGFNVPKGKELKPENALENVHMIDMEDFVLGTNGWWHCQRLTHLEGTPPNYRETAMEDTSGASLFHFEFDANLPDKLFELPKATPAGNDK